jgi:peptidyl-prolyl cis-trans isomerase D
VLEQQKAGAAEQTFASALASDAKKNGLDKAAAAKGLHVVTTDYIAKDGVIAGLADGSGLLTQAFAVVKGADPASVSTGDGFAVFQVQDVKTAHAPDFATYKDHILNDYREQQIPQLLNSQLAKLDDRAKVLKDLKKAAAELNVPVKTSDLVGKDGRVRWRSRCRWERSRGRSIRVMRVSFLACWRSRNRLRQILRRTLPRLVSSF